MTPSKAWAGAVGLLLAACASQPPTTQDPTVASTPSIQTEPAEAAKALPRHWQGRISLSVHQTPMQTVFAGFELDGDPQSGEMRILGPLGSAAMVLQWQPGKATVSDGQHSRSAPELQQLMQQLTGVDLPIGLIFDGLYGRPMAAPGWWIAPNEGRQDRLYAVRLEPLPRIELMIHLQNAQP
jgi:outer membrane lipoprotein LolB